MKKLVLVTTFLLVNLLANDITKEDLGRALFFDVNLSKNRTQSCATCHNPEAGFIDSRDNGVSKMASLGDDLKSLGDRQAPTASYAKFSPKFHFNDKKGFYVGGQFWDGRASTLEEQAGGPPLNPIEMGMRDEKEVVDRLKENSFYVNSFENLFGKDIFKDDKKAYEAMSEAIASFERTDEFSPFDSKYDRYLRGEYELSALEDLGMSIFFSNQNNSCATCHILKGEGKEGETFSNYEFHNIGVPKNKELRAKNGVKEKDLGLLANPNVKDKNQIGKYKTPTLRNVAVTAPYMHNGVFKDLRTVVLFYDKYNNKKNIINPETNLPWDEPEHPDNISITELRAIAQNDRKVDALVAFMKLLTDKRYEHLIED
ncbi:cytochrome-c peroxidase [Aliarcobacter skirrowii]|uniref:Diheme cytochrome c peroxidase n=1 Tax=Aliarcobacter skirrowii CCUG 10374 TaxID=1032239 RepID=A0AAD0WNG7_9BACT|nr:cytochrome c peroxidase [Aliarcobacter skirrowii]AXX84761.1 diheme cytochrome c peroxidase [Aliarcobacter skirrowii CCUG 10374]KAB0620342.1 methylamine utilization protein MauG [Aliarcobacter skirrowii CCUG 10374]RXI25533.1 methylamine utilization protein MauG [Aliarcobacter skirrowii CCUG 10374]SUV14935.1 Methylamine utilization protein MauG precursor [Aliarcobacter skirrowii]